MLKTSRLFGALLALTGVFALSGCAEVVASGAVLDHENAVFVLDQTYSYEGMEEYYNRSIAGEFDISGTSNASDETTVELDGVWVSTEEDSREIFIDDETLEIYDTSSGVNQLIWSGDFTAPRSGATSLVWESTLDPAVENTLPDAAAQIEFFYSNGVLNYTEGESEIFLGRPGDVVSEDSEEQASVEDRASALTSDELCAYVLSDVQEAFHAPGEDNVYECGESGFHLVTTYPVTYDYTGVTSVGGEEITPAERRSLPFSVSIDSVYGDVVFEHQLLGLSTQRYFSSPQEWLEAFTNYSVEFSFPGEVTEFSNSGIQSSPESVSWDYALISDAVSSGDYTLSAAGRADPQVNPLPIMLTLGGILFLLVLVVYFMWKRFSPKVIIVTSYILSIVNPFGLALAIVAHKKARNNAEGLAQATLAIWINSAIFIFQLLVIGLMVLLAPEVVLDFLTSVGLASSGT